MHKTIGGVHLKQFKIAKKNLTTFLLPLSLPQMHRLTEAKPNENMIRHIFSFSPFTEPA